MTGLTGLTGLTGVADVRRTPYPRSALSSNSTEVAPALLGAVLVVGTAIARIVEVEAYGGADDPASHAHRGPTARNAAMFGPPGTLYVYRSFGIHWCANVVTGRPDDPQAVLLRAVEPMEGLEEMWRRRSPITDPRRLTDGPGKLCAAMGIDGSHNGVDLCAAGSPVRLCRGAPPVAIASSPRIGISVATERPWRWFDAGSASVSSTRSARRARRAR